ncbi:hypothetical protein [Nocardia vaccinii]|uniref:hypothetical protein n=1 Tax=Nocardia vaccinii TaxID=1822 RepID=UPI000A5BD0C9|nr:hypothetical protein [Nocardia vaccinii]
MTRRSRDSHTSALRRAMLPIVGAIPVAIVVTCAAGNAAAQPSVPAPAPVGQHWTAPVRHGITPRNPHIGPVPIGGLHPVDDNYSDRVTQQTLNGGTAGAIIGTAATAIPAAAFGAVPGALIGGAIGATIGGIAGGVALAVPTVGIGAPVGVLGGALVGAGVGAAAGAVVGAVAAAVPTGIAGGVFGYELGAATGNGNGQQG